MQTIDCTPTWTGVLAWLIAGIQDGNSKGRTAAKKELQHMAEVADAHVAMINQRGEIKLQNELGMVCRPKGDVIGSTDDKFYLELSFIDMHIITSALAHYRYMNSEFYNKKEGHRDHTNKVADLLGDLYCHDVPDVNVNDYKVNIATMGGFTLRQLSNRISEVFFAVDNDNDVWWEDIINLFDEYKLDHRNLLDSGVTVDGEYYPGFMEDLNRESVKTMEDVEAKIIHLGFVVDSMSESNSVILDSDLRG